MLRIVGVAALLLAALLVTFALPVETWRTGDQGLTPLESAPAAATPRFSRRVWIDTDAACGHTRRTDPDDCFAIALLLRFAELDIVGISTVAGNAAQHVVDATTRKLVGDTVPVHGGWKALQAALEKEPLTLLALGPLTNVAGALGERPELAAHVSRVVAVMGRRPGHIFHPAEGAGGGILFGHGPVFRDFNFALDRQAAARILELELPLTLVPYDAARGIELNADDLDRLQPALPWVVGEARGWLDYWRTDIGRAGFYPFDLLAAAYVVEPSGFRCTRVRARVGRDRTLFIPWLAEALLVEPSADGRVLYCARAHGELKASLLRRLFEASDQ